MSETSGKSGRVLGIALIFGVVAAAGYWIYVYVTEGSAPSLGDLWDSIRGGVANVTGIGKLSFSDLQSYASNAGFSGDDLNTACAVALAESSGIPTAVGDVNVTPGGSIGLWQVNLKAHPQYTASQLKDPQTNANAAYAIYQAAGNSFSPWTTFSTGAYLSYLPASTPSSDTTASAAPTQDDSTDNTADASVGAQNISDGDSMGGTSQSV